MASRDDEFTRFVAFSSPALTRLAWFLTGNAEIVADLVQEAYVKTYLAWGRVRTEDALAYARTVLVNTNIDRLRRRRARPETALPDGFEAADPRQPTAEVEQRDRVARMLAPLPRRQRQVVVLRYALDLSEHDTAELLGISVGTVKSAAARALARLREQNTLPSPES